MYVWPGGLRMARQLFDRGYRVDTVFLGYDATLVRKDEDELNTWSSLDWTATNPLNGGYKGRILLPQNAFGHVSAYFRGHQVVGGQEVALISGVHGTVGMRSDFGVDEGLILLTNLWDPIIVWRVGNLWESQWVNMKHEDIGRSYDPRDQARTGDPSYAYLIQSLYELDGQSCSSADKNLCRESGGDACYRSLSGGPICWFKETSSSACVGGPGIWTTPTSTFATNHPDSLPAGKAACITQVANL